MATNNTEVSFTLEALLALAITKPWIPGSTRISPERVAEGVRAVQASVDQGPVPPGYSSSAGRKTVSVSASGLRPSQVITREYAVTREWAHSIYETKQHDGVSWRTFYGSQWASVGLWDWSSPTVDDDLEVLTLDHSAVEGAAAEIFRPIVRQP